jgi:hypothetical protein
MKKTPLIKTGLAMLALIAASGIQADDIKAKVYFTGSLFNGSTSQAIHGSFVGKGEYGPFNNEGKFTGNVTSKPGTRTPESRLTGRYPVSISVRVAALGASASDSFDTTLVVRRRSLFNEEVGAIKLRRAIDPSKKGRQRISGSGVLKYDF